MITSQKTFTNMTNYYIAIDVRGGISGSTLPEEEAYITLPAGQQGTVSYGGDFMYYLRVHFENNGNVNFTQTLIDISRTGTLYHFFNENESFKIGFDDDSFMLKLTRY
ncbi:hypothetical protein [Xenorhabdus thuongxuanensis]|nr:hypothetical protein [Xenorhabdus thuongxuanensis]